MKPPIKAETVLEILARELHRNYRAAAKAMGVIGSQAHDHGVRDCGARQFHYFEKRAALILKRSTMPHPENVGQAEERLSAMILFKRMIVEAPNFIVCRYCTAPFDRLGGITTTEGYFCYDCVKILHKISDQTAALRERPKQAILSDIDQTA